MWAIAAQRDNSTCDVEVVHQRLETGFGGIESVLYQENLGSVNRVERCLEMEIEPVEVASLTVAETCVLFCIKEAELGLEAAAIDIHDAGGGQGDVGREENLASYTLRSV